MGDVGSGEGEGACDHVHGPHLRRLPSRSWRGPESNRRHHGFQPCALPTELPRLGRPSVAAPGIVLGRAGQEGRRHRRAARPRSRAARRRHGAVRHPLRRASTIGWPELGYEIADWGNVETAVAEATATGDPRARFLPEIKEACGRIAGLVGRAVRRGPDPARPRRRPLGRARHARRAGGGAGAGRRALARRARRPEHAGDVAERERARDAARGRPRPCRETPSPMPPGRCPRSTPSASCSSAYARWTRASARTYARPGWGCTR